MAYINNENLKEIVSAMNLAKACIQGGAWVDVKDKTEAIEQIKSSQQIISAALITEKQDGGVN
jgi:hypothetical protein